MFVMDSCETCRDAVFFGICFFAFALSVQDQNTVKKALTGVYPSMSGAQPVLSFPIRSWINQELFESMGPSNDRELAITIATNKISAEGRLSTASVAEVGLSLHFAPSKSDCEFLVKYVRWRMDNPTAK